MHAPPHQVIRELAASPRWCGYFAQSIRQWIAHPPEFYYDPLAPHAARIEMWCTDYLHVLNDVVDLVEWYKGTGLRPWLDALPDDATRNRLLAEYHAALVPHFPPRSDGRILFPFRRLFFIAYR